MDSRHRSFGQTLGRAPPAGPRAESAYLQPDMGALVERKRRNRKLTVKMFWLEHCEAAAAAGRSAYAYQTFCEMFARAAEKTGATRRLAHEPGAKAYIDWAGDTASLTDRLTGARTKVYVIVVALPYSGRFWAQGFTDMRQRSWQEGQARALEDFGGVPRMLVPDNAATATDRSSVYVTLVNAEYQRFAEHYGAAVVPARIRRPRDKAVAESTVDLVERWIVAPANEMTSCTLGEFNDFCLERVRWLNARPFSAKEGSRDSVYEAEERPHMQPLPSERYEMCEWRSCKVAPDYHVTVDHMRYSVPFRLIGTQVDVRLSDSRVTVMSGGEAVAEHARLRGRKVNLNLPRFRLHPYAAILTAPSIFPASNSAGLRLPRAEWIPTLLQRHSMHSKISSAACSRVSKVLACTHSALMRPMSDSIAALSHGEDIDPIEGPVPASRIVLPSSSETHCEP